MDTNTDPNAAPAADPQKGCAGTDPNAKADTPSPEPTPPPAADPETKAEDTPPGAPPDPASDAEKSADEPPPPAEPDPAEEMRSMARLFNLPELAESAIQRKLTVEKFRLELKSHIITNKGVNIMADTSKNYSICRALQALINPDIDVSVEREASDLLSRESGMVEKRGRGMMLSIRRDDPMFQRLFSREGEFTGAVGDGASLIGTDHRGDLFVKALRTRMGVNGATVLSGLQGNVEIPVQTGFSSIGVSALNATAGKTKPTVSSVTLSPKKFSAYTVIGEDLLYQGNPDAMAFVMDDLMGQLARKLDLAILTGIEDPEILGIDGTTGVQTVTIADLTAPTWLNILAFGGKVADYEMDEGTLAWITKGTTQANLKGVSKDTGSGRFLLEDGKMDGYPVNICGGLGAEALYLGAWRNVIIGQWGGVYVKIDDVTGIKEGSVTIVAKLLADIAITNPNAFVKRIDGSTSTTATT